MDNINWIRYEGRTNVARICFGCGVSFDSIKANKHFCDKCYQKNYHKTYYEQNAEKLKQYGRDYFHKKQALFKSSKPVPINTGVRVRIVAPELSTNGKIGTVIAWQTRGWKGRGIRVLLDGYKRPQIYHFDLVSFIVEGN